MNGFRDIINFWKYLKLLVYQGLNITEDAFQDTASQVIFFKQKPVLKEVMQTVEEMANHLYGPRPKRGRKTKKRKSEGGGTTERG